MSDDFPRFITVAAEDRLGQCEYIRRTLAEKRVADLQQRIRELTTLVESAYREGFLDGYDDYARPQDADTGWEHSDVRKRLEQLL